MKPNRNTLTDAELLILLEGELSDNLDVSDDELDPVSSRNEHAVPTSPVASRLDPEMIEVLVGKGEDLDVTALRLRLQMSLSVGAEVQVARRKDKEKEKEEDEEKE
jgi:hypothetical protein